ncbi:MAG: hypothetical protein H0X36_09730 [Sphingomonadaceae bacterium]|nr:hypothetical protein [Sphingomonadaceae bacterium]
MLLAATAAVAQDAARPASVSPACRQEVMTLCPKTGDREARRACMKEKFASVSPGCRSEIMAARAARRAERPVPGESTMPTDNPGGNSF